MSTAATAPQILLTGGVAAGASGLVLQRAKTRDELRQSQRDQMLKAAVDLIESVDAATVTAARILNSATEDTFETIASTDENLAAMWEAIEVLDAKITKVKLLFGPESETGLACDEFFDTLDEMHTALRQIRAAHGDETVAIDDVDGSLLQPVIENSVLLGPASNTLLPIARREIGSPQSLASRPRKPPRFLSRLWNS